MGRVDEALRRAADAARHGRTGGDDAATMAMGAEPALDPGVFPSESPASEAPARSAVRPPVNPLDRDLEPAPAAPTEDALPEPVATTASMKLIDPSLAQKVVIDSAIVPVSREQYRRLAAALHHAQAARGVRVVMIASAAVGEGKTLTASNLALTLSESYQRTVLLIDADLRRPSVHKVFRTDGSPGLTEGLMADVDRKLALHQVTPRLTILPAGQASSDPMAGLTSPRMRRLLEEAREAFAWVIIDTPPVGLLTDANLLASMVDGAVLVVHAGVTPYDQVKRAVEAIGANKMLGVVLNRAETPVHGYGYGYHGAYARYEAPDADAKTLR